MMLLRLSGSHLNKNKNKIQKKIISLDIYSVDVGRANYNYY